jgi:hypothetical protein
MAADTAALEISPSIQAKLRVLQQKLGTQDLDTALDKSLNIANFVADTLNDPERKLLVENQGKFTEMTTIN